MKIQFPHCQRNAPPLVHELHLDSISEMACEWRCRINAAPLAVRRGRSLLSTISLVEWDQGNERDRL
jgi:hypothetical protein